MPQDNDHGLAEVPPHQRPNMPRVCYAGKLTMEDAQERLGPNVKILEIRPAQCVRDNQVVEATEVIYSIIERRTCRVCGSDRGAQHLPSCPEYPAYLKDA